MSNTLCDLNLIAKLQSKQTTSESVQVVGVLALRLGLEIPEEDAALTAS